MVKIKLNWLRHVTRKKIRKKSKITYADFVPNGLRIPNIYAACLSDISPNGNIFQKKNRNVIFFSGSKNANPERTA